VAYLLRAFCTARAIPPLDEVLAWVASEHGIVLHRRQPADSAAWEHAEITYGAGSLPLLAEVSVVGDREGLAREEIEEFVDALSDAPASREKERVISHLRATQAVVAVQVPTSDGEDGGSDAATAFLAFFAERRRGLIQADGEGFYDGGELIVELDGESNAASTGGTPTGSRIGFVDEWDSWLVLDDALAEIVERLRAVGEKSRDPATGEHVDPVGAEVSADTLDVALETETGQLWLDERDRPALRWALEERSGPGAPDWVVGLGRKTPAS
jgi:hypothetical protein